MFIVDFVHIHSRRAAQSGLDLSRDDHWWEYAKQIFHPTMVMQGLDPDSTPLPTEVDAEGPSFVIWINSGTYHAQCPDCGGHSIPRRGVDLHMCLGCWHGGDLRWRMVDWPEDIDKIDQVLLSRPRSTNRNWHLGETLAQLADENTLRGLPIPAGMN